jgi:membrane-bound metal-dependent hydrolase YbcI (DUF457 family)
MPSPIGHALAGIATVWVVDLVPGNRAWRSVPGSSPWYQRAGGGLSLLCAGLGAAPDLDLATATHRTATHSFTAVLCVGAVAAAVAAKTDRPAVRIAIMCAAAYGSHLLLDWLGTDQYFPYGLQLLWPFSRHWFISGWDVFRQTNAKHIFTYEPMVTNLRAIIQELAILGPIAVALWLLRVRALAGLAPQGTRRHLPPQ